MPNVAIVTPDPPIPSTSGGRLRVAQHLGVLLRMGWDVSVDAFTRSNQEAAVAPLGHPHARMAVHALPAESRWQQVLRIVGAAWTGDHPEWARLRPSVERVLSEVLARRPDVLLLESSLLSALVPALKRTAPSIPLIVDAHNAESVLLQQLLAISSPSRVRARLLLERRAMVKLEGEMLPLADEVWVPAEADAVALRGIGVRNVRVVPNAIDTEFYRPTADEDANALVFPGIFSHLPNVDAAAQLCRNILPLVRKEIPVAHLFLVGKDQASITRWAGRDVTVTGRVEDIRPYLSRAAVVVVPLRYGSGTRLKILEAFGLGKAVVSTRKGCEGLEVTDNVHLCIADSPAAFADRVVDLLKHPERRRRLGAAARDLVEAKYSWRAMAHVMRTRTLIGSLAGVESR